MYLVISQEILSLNTKQQQTEHKQAPHKQHMLHETANCQKHTTECQTLSYINKCSTPTRQTLSMQYEIVRFSWFSVSFPVRCQELDAIVIRSASRLHAHEFHSLLGCEVLWGNLNKNLPPCTLR